MTTEDNQAVDELFDTASDTTESTQDSEVPDDDQNTESSTEETNNKAEIERQKVIAAALRKVKSGEITIDQIKHDWVKKEVKAQLETTKPESVNDLVQKALKKEKEEDRYQSTRTKLNDANLTAEKRALITEKNRFYLEKGLSKADALDTAIAIANVKLDSDTRFAARIPKISNNKADPESTIKESLAEGNVPDVSAEERLKVWEKMRKQTQR